MSTSAAQKPALIPRNPTAASTGPGSPGTAEEPTDSKVTLRENETLLIAAIRDAQPWVQLHI
jgi:hypothetical protein